MEMKSLKIKVNTAEESKEVQELLFKLGYIKKDFDDYETPFYIANYIDGTFSNYVLDVIDIGWKETTLAELRAMVVLKRNDVNDATHESSIYKYFKACDDWYYFDLGCTDKWQKSSGAKPEYYEKLKTIEKEEMKEYLNKNTYEYKQAHSKPDGEWVCIPAGADFYVKSKMFEDSCFFCKDNFGIIETFDTMKKNSWHKESTLATPDLSENYDILWVRPTQPEALPFIDDNPQSLNEQYAEIEGVRQSLKDNVNHPSHYTQGKVECIDALESATIGKTGIEAVCVANIIKYLWRYEEKNGLEDIKKANFYLNRLIATLENNNG